jgi:N-glycosylase/DNA lyase
MTTLTLAAPKRFRLQTVLLGHGFIDLAPHRHVWGSDRFATTLSAAYVVVDANVVQSGSELRLEVPTKLDAAARAAVRGALRRMLRMDEDLSDFWRLCASEQRLRWVARRGAGRLLRSPTLFEDLVKLLFTTNCAWANTRGMTARLVQALGEPAPSGARAFPSAQRCAEAGEKLFREQVRAGYRASSLARLSREFADRTELARALEDRALSTDELRRRLLDLPGFGPYAAGQALRLLGHYTDLALDSWCKDRLADLTGRRRAPSERAVERMYARFGRWRGLALWMDLTAKWHFARTPRDVQPLVLK